MESEEKLKGLCGGQSCKATQWSQIQKKFVQAAQTLCKKVTIAHVPKPVIQEERDKLQE